MKIKSKNKFKVNVKKFKKNLNNIHLTLDENNETCRSYGTKTSHRFSSENFLHIKLEENYVTLSLSSFGGMCGFEFDTEEIFKDFKVKNLADIDDLCLMRDVYVLINDCIIEDEPKIKEYTMKYFTTEKIKENIADVLDGYDGYYEDLHNDVFNTKYYADNKEDAVKMLEEYGIFKAIKKVQDFQKTDYGECFTDFSNPQEIANFLYYLLGYEFITENEKFSEIINEYRNNKATDKVNKMLIDALK